MRLASIFRNVKAKTRIPDTHSNDAGTASLGTAQPTEADAAANPELASKSLNNNSQGVNQYLDYSKMDIDINKVSRPLLTSHTMDNNITIIDNSLFKVELFLIDKLILINKEFKRKREDEGDVPINDDADDTTDNGMINGNDTISIRGYLTLKLKQTINVVDIDVRLLGTNNINYFNNLNLITSKKDISRSQLIFLDELINFKNYNPNLNQIYNLPFQFLVNSSSLPQTVIHDIVGSVKYQVGINIQIDNKDSYHLVNDFKLVYCMAPSMKSLPNDILAIGNWRNLLYYQFIMHAKNVTLNQNFHCSIRVLPILKPRFKIHSIKVTLIQSITYTQSEHDNKVKFFTITETVPLKHKLMGDGSEHSINTDFEVKLIESFNLLNKSFKIYPSTNSSFQNPFNPNFEITHKLKLGVVLEELGEYDSSDIMSSMDSSLCEDEQVPIETTQTPITNYYNPACKSKTNDDLINSWIMENAKLLKEKTRSVNKKIELAVCSKVNILDAMSILGNEPPPSFESANPTPVKRDISITTAATTTTITSSSHLDTSTDHQHQSLAAKNDIVKKPMGKFKSFMKNTAKVITTPPTPSYHHYHGNEENLSVIDSLTTMSTNSSTFSNYMTDLSIISSFDHFDHEFSGKHENEMNLPTYNIIDELPYYDTL